MQPIEHKAKMQPRADAPPGRETDGAGNVIPLDQRTPEDQAKAAPRGVKNPEHEAENPAPMPRARQGESTLHHPSDPAGQQGSTRR